MQDRCGPASDDTDFGGSRHEHSSHLPDAPERQAFVVLRSGFVLAPILFRIDKFFNFIVDWPTYLAPWIKDILPDSGQQAMHVVGVVEILAGLLVAAAPRFGAYVVAAWLAGIVVNLLTVDAPKYYDIALRDFGLLIAALALGRLAATRTPGVSAKKAAAAPRERELVETW